MSRRIAGLVAIAAVVLAAPAAEAHGLIGKRFFPATLGVDDPFVADELSLPTISHIKVRGEGDEPPSRETEFSAEFSKRLSPDFGFSLGATARSSRPSARRGSRARTGAAWTRAMRGSIPGTAGCSRSRCRRWRPDGIACTGA